MALTKTNLVEMMYDKLGIPKAEAVNLVESTLDIIKGELAQGKSIKITGFGNWIVRQKTARPGRNPQTGKVMSITARKVVTWKPSILLRNAINKENKLP